MTLQEKERRIEEIGGGWADLMRTFQKARRTHLQAMDTLKKAYPRKYEAIREEIAQYNGEYEQILDKILELAEPIG